MIILRTDNMIQDIAPHFLSNQYHNYLPEDEDILLVCSPLGVLIFEGDRLRFPTVALCRSLVEIEQLKYLFAIDDTRYFLYFMESASEDIVGFTYRKMNDIRAMRDNVKILAAATGWHLYTWYRNHQYCGRCGKKVVPDRHLRALNCPECGNMIFPVIAPAVIVAVTNGDKILLTKYANRAYTRFALIAGFTEIGESAEQTVAREVMEEAGLKVKNIRYYKSQPWGFDSNLLLGFFCEVDGDETITMDDEELAVAQWVHKSDIPEYEEGLALTHEMMMFFKNMD